MKTYFIILTSLCSVITLLLFVYSSLKDIINTKAFISSGRIVVDFGILPESEEYQEVKENSTKINSLKYILQWTSDLNVPFVYMGNGREGFISRKCPYTNCFVTSNRTYLSDYTNFDVIAFAGPELLRYPRPKRRSPHQKYVFASIESPDYYPVCSNNFDGYFNWTWTYKLDSEVHWGYIVVRDFQDNIIGPRKDMNWLKPDEMAEVSHEFKRSLRTKNKAAAWFVSNCVTQSNRENFVIKLKRELSKYQCSDTNCTVDIYGDCGPFVCSRDNEQECDKNIEKTYYFYLSFENSYSEDYVTEKLLRALNNNAVPIVYGGANYSRFIPEGAYLNAKELDIKKLAAKMHELINNPDEYAKYFRWKNHYKYHKTDARIDTNEYCRFCALLNDEKLVKEVSVYNNFRQWWDPPNFC